MSASVNIFSVHYFLWFAALTSIYGYFSVYAEHYANASSSQYGLLNMILPFVTIVAKIFFCSLADRRRAYRSFFIWFLVASLIGFGSFSVLPFTIEAPKKESGLVLSTWVLICLMTSVSTISMGVVACLSDAFAMNSSKKLNSSYGAIRVWGTIGWGVSSILISWINQSDKVPLLVPGLLLTVGLIVIDILAAIFWPHRDDFKLDKSGSSTTLDEIVPVSIAKDTTANTPAAATNKVPISEQAEEMNNSALESGSHVFQVSPKRVPAVGQEQQSSSDEVISDVAIQWLLFKEVARRRKSLFRYIILFIFAGALMSIQWSFFFLYLNKIYPQDFAYISALSMVAQAFLGELPFFILSELIIRILGRTHTLSLSIALIGLRYLLYEYLLPNSSMYYVLLSEPIQGPSFGLFYVVLTEVGLDYSNCEEAIVKIVEDGVVPNNPEQVERLRMALRATMQGLMSACYEGLGLGIGSIVGGLVIDYYGFHTLWIGSSIIAILLGLINSIIDLGR